MVWNGYKRTGAMAGIRRAAESETARARRGGRGDVAGGARPGREAPAPLAPRPQARRAQQAERQDQT